MTKVVNRRLNIYIDQGTAEQSLAALTKQEDKLTAAIERQRKAGKDATAEMNRLADTRRRIGELKDVMDGKVLPSVRMAEAAVQKLNRELKQLPANGEAAARKLQELRAAEATLSRVRNAANGVNNSLNDIAKNQGFLGKIQNGLGSLIGPGGLLAGGIIGGAAALGQAVTFLSDAVSEALQANEAAARLKATLDNLGRADAFENLANQADAFADSVGYLDNDDVIGVFEKLITYGKLTEKQIMDLTPVIIDFAAKQRIELSESASVIIKALEGNGKALKEYGINVKDAKDETEAYGIIMDQLAPKVSGSAKAFSEELNGSIATTRQEIKNLKEDIGTELLPVVDKFWKVIRGALSGLKDLISDLRIVSNSDNFSFGDRLSFISGRIDPELRARIEAQRAANVDKNKVDPVTGKDGYGRVYRPDNSSALGSGSTTSKKDEQNAKTERERKAREAQQERDRLKRERDAALKDFQDVQKQVENATAPILSAYRKINEEAEDRIKKIQEVLKRGLITPAEAQQALDGVERVLNQQRDELGSKFKLTSSFVDSLPGGPDFDAAMEEDVKWNGKALGEKVRESIIKGVSGEGEGNQENGWDEALRKFKEEYFNPAMEIAGQLVGLFDAIGVARSNAEQAAFEREVANNDKRRDSARKLLEQKLISQQEYDRRIANIDKQQDQRQKDLAKRQFERDKNANTARALMQGAAAQLETLSRFGAPIPPNFIGIAASALTLALTAANIIAIRSAKPPQFEKGGFIPSGSSHAQGGISLVDNRTGARVGEVEGGEPILSRKTYARNKPLIDALMAASQSGTGTLSLNVPKLVQARQTIFENGGFIPKSGENGSIDMSKTLAQLTAILQRGIKADVVFGEYEAKADRINNIRSQSIIS